MQTTVEQKPWRQTAKGEGRDGGKGLGLESGLAGALRQSLNKAGEEERNTESKRAAGPGLPRIASFFLIACWRAIEQPLTFPTPLPLHSVLLWEMTTNSPPLLWESPQSNLCLFYFSNHMGPDAFCYLVTRLWITRNTSLRAPHWPRLLEWIFNIWLEERQASIIL